jgi:DNA replication initiation complex subunit (GINS family)
VKVMYNELYTAWQREIDDPTLGALQLDFYAKIAEYLQHIKAEDKVLDKKSVKMNLLEREALNVERMLKELLGARYKKIIRIVTKNQKLPSELLTAEEARMCETFADFTKAYQNFANYLMQGQIEQIAESYKVPIKVVLKTETAPIPKRSTIRFLKNIPAIMGADMKSYGPFATEDVASLPPQNAQILVKQGLAVLVEVS